MTELSLDLANKEILMAQSNQHFLFKYMEFVLRRKHFLTDVAVVTINSETVSTQVAQTRNMSNGEHRHCCVTFKI